MLRNRRMALAGSEQVKPETVSPIFELEGFVKNQMRRCRKAPAHGGSEGVIRRS